ncbi:hypothetical protein [Rhizobium laguerreae]|uniref:hypothetical protein n=1 Tax=Rhizobium laguerreae TaxID=1076926 RepID=UPI001C8FFFE6|nr:hypothetical protein [Rhizobium laguerreae]MBY3483293.1 hypothetical protein [Rhizobium laguerreae]
MTQTIEKFRPAHVIEQATQQLIGTFESAIVSAIEAGSLIALRWHLHQEEHRPVQDCPSELIPDARKIVARWSEIEGLHGEGSLIVEESKIIQYSLATPGNRHEKGPHLLENARNLRGLKGLDWWRREHQLHSLLEVVRS